MSWIIFACVLFVVFIVNIPAFFQYARMVCTLPDVGFCPTEQLTPAYIQILNQLHLPVAAAEVSLAVLCIIVSVVYWLLGLLVFWRKSREPMGFFVSLILIMFASTGFLGFNLPTQTPPFFQAVALFICYGLMWPAMIVFFFIFPTGRFMPRWTWAAFIPFFSVTLLASFPSTTPFVPVIAVILTSLLPIVVQVYRYTRIYNGVQKQQTKWFVFGLSTSFLLIIIQGILQVIAPDKLWYQLFNGPFWLVIWTIMLFSVSIPILRYRLWDIDIIINRALVYGFLTVLLVALYIGLILALQALVRVVIGSPSQEPFIVVVSTLVIAVVFQPLRRALQSLIDRRFYRSKYDAAKITTTFGSTLRDEVNLEQLCEQLLTVVQETMRPSSITLWVCPPNQADNPSLQINELLLEDTQKREGAGE
ncbi:MAG TPA: hypothetical protein VFN35_24870 [Ktedonobacteraceae bacterium]|nr:hypothetical protein [Ktedonobacteraceae bacterium]